MEDMMREFVSVTTKQDYTPSSIQEFRRVTIQMHYALKTLLEYQESVRYKKTQEDAVETEPQEGTQSVEVTGIFGHEEHKPVVEEPKDVVKSESIVIEMKKDDDAPTLSQPPILEATAPVIESKEVVDIAPLAEVAVEKPKPGKRWFWSSPSYTMNMYILCHSVYKVELLRSRIEKLEGTMHIRSFRPIGQGRRLSRLFEATWNAVEVENEKLLTPGVHIVNDAPVTDTKHPVVLVSPDLPERDAGTLEFTSSKGVEQLAQEMSELAFNKTLQQRLIQHVKKLRTKHRNAIRYDCFDALLDDFHGGKFVTWYRFEMGEGAQTDLVFVFEREDMPPVEVEKRHDRNWEVEKPCNDDGLRWKSMGMCSSVHRLQLVRALTMVRTQIHVRITQ